MSDIKWTPAQRAAIDINADRILVSAAAGSGKSTVLTERIISAITREKNPHDLQRLMVVTFTRASAEDLKNKISSAVKKAVAEQPSNKRLNEQLIKLPSAKINTIHGLCYSLIKSRFDLLNLPAAISVADETVVTSLRLEIMEKLLNRCFNGMFEPIKDFASFCEFFIAERDSNLTKIFLEIYDKIRNDPDGFDVSYENGYLAKGEDFLSTDFGKIVCRHILILTDYFKSIFKSALDYCAQSEDYSKLASAFAVYVSYIETLENAVKQESLSLVCELIDKIPTFPSVKVANITEKIEYFKAERSSFRAELKAVRDKILCFSAEEIEKLGQQTSLLSSQILALLKEFDRCFSEAKLKRSIIDFSDLEHYTLKLLYNADGSVSEAAREISSSLDEIYVDEYQDLNPLQNKIFKALSVSCPIFMVGDIKQSIYGFRGADPTAFGEYKKSFPAYEPSDTQRERVLSDVSIFLSNNFRSDLAITEFSNVISDAVFGTPSENEIYGYRIPYAHSDRLVWSRAATEHSEENEVIILNCHTEDGENTSAKDDSASDSTYALEAEMVSNEIAELVKSGVKASDIAILLRGTKNSAPVFENALKRRDIPVNSEKGAKLFDAPEVQLALCLLNCCDNPYRDIFLTGALRSPVFGFTLNELITIKRAYKNATSLFAALCEYTVKESFEKGARFLEFISKMREYANKNTVDRVLWQIYTETSFFSVIYDGGKVSKQKAASRRANLIKLHEIAKGYSSSPSNSLYGFIEKIRILTEQDKSPSAALTDGTGVSIMSIHSSKGLEFEYCFVCGTSHILNTEDSKKDLMFDSNIGFGIRLKDSSRLSSFETPYRTALKTQIKLLQTDEEMRMLYVALTRAKTKLYVCSSVDDFEERIQKAYMSAEFSHPFTYFRRRYYIDWILTALHTKTDLVPRFKYVNKGRSQIESESANALSVNYTDADSIKKLLPEELTSFSEDLKERLLFVYPHQNSSKLPSKLSVSKLYPEILDEPVFFGGENIFSDTDSANIFDGYGENATKTDMANLKVPDFAIDTKAATGAQIGTATHVFMQFCNFDNLKKFGIEEEISRLTKKRFILKEHAELIDRSAITGFIESKLYKMLKEAAEVNREYRFNIKLPAKDFTSDIKLKEALENESVFVQGIIDCYLRDSDGKIILIDYKTDFVPKEIRGDIQKENEFFINRHALQLSYYRKALHTLTKEQVHKTYIFSFALGREIEIPSQ